MEMFGLNRDHILMLAAALAVIAIGWQLMHKSRDPASVAGSPVKMRTDPFPEGVEIFNRLDSSSRTRLINVVNHFCGQRYHAQSCLHYLIKCGHACLAFLTPDEQRRIVASYKELSHSNEGR